MDEMTNDETSRDKENMRRDLVLQCKHHTSSGADTDAAVVGVSTAVDDGDRHRDGDRDGEEGW